MKKFGRTFGLYAIILLIVVLILWMAQLLAGDDSSYRYKDYMKDLEAGNVKAVTINQNQQVPTGSIKVTLKDGNTKKFYALDVYKIWKTTLDYDIDPYITNVRTPNVFLTNVLPYIVIVIILFIFMSGFSAQAGGNNQKMMNFGRSRATMVSAADAKKINFNNVAGITEEKEELMEIVDFLKDPKKYIDLGARIPKGVILVGPPGTGKTLLAKAVAGEAGVPFFSISGSDFVEMFVGVGASRVRDMFAEAKKNAPCIVFIDEIDAVARRRGAGMGGGHDEREQTLNQMLVEMDGFSVNEGIIVIAATNRVDILDPAIMRPGRFDRKVYVNRPDVQGREDILKVHIKNKPVGDDVNLHDVARTTAGFTGADLENLLNEAAIHAARSGNKFIKDEDIKKAFIKISIGVEKKSKVISDKEKKMTAYHEAGHAILFHLLPDMGPVYTVSIIPAGGAGGYTMPLPEKDEMYITKNKMLQHIIVDFGGRAAEKLIFDEETTGASQDIKQATQTARQMVTRYGFSEKLGPILYEADDEEVFVGRDYGHTKTVSEKTQDLIDEEVKRIITESNAKAEQILTENMEILHKCADLLLEKERITREEFEALFN